MIIPRPLRAAAALAAAKAVTAQTYTECNPLQSTSCPANTALGMAIDIDFTHGSVNSFEPSGGSPQYSRDGVTFTVSKSHDAPQLNSMFYIMFGRVEITLKCAPGAGIVSSLVLESDDLDEIDMEWLGTDPDEVQTNYFGKGRVTNYNRGQFNPAKGTHDRFVTYTIDWTADRIVWYVERTAVRTLAYNDAEKGQYPQTPMRIKFGAWPGGDPSNPPGTVEWARGPTDYSQGPFSMLVRRLAVTDYSTGKSYKYGDTSGSWQSIVAKDGRVNGNLGRAGDVTVTASAPAQTQLSPSVPRGGIGKGSTSTWTDWPWVATGTAPEPERGIPSGWVMTSDGKIVPDRDWSRSAGGSVRPPHVALWVGPVLLGLLAAVAGRRAM